MRANRSIPQCTVIPVLAYPSVGDAVDWLCDVFGFSLRIRIGHHRAQLKVGDGAVVVTEGGSPDKHARVMVRVESVDTHHERCFQRGARILSPPSDQPYGERQYSVEDFAGHHWTFSESIADVAPESWGGEVGQL